MALSVIDTKAILEVVTMASGTLLVSVVDNVSANDFWIPEIMNLSIYDTIELDEYIYVSIDTITLTNCFDYPLGEIGTSQY